MRSAPAKPLLGLLLATVVFFALWIVALKPSSSTSGGSPAGLGQYQSAINKAHQAAATSNAANARLGAPTATVSAPKSQTTVKAPPSAKPATKASTATKATSAPKATSATTATKDKAAVKKADVTSKPVITHVPVTVSAAAEVKLLASAVAAHDVVAILFYNPAAADDQAIKNELALVPTHHGEVVKLAVPVSELTEFQAITAQVPVVTAPTLVVIDPTRQATLITGYASQLEINQRVADALAVK